VSNDIQRTFRPCILTAHRFDKLNPEINLPSNVKVPLEPTTWPHSGPRRASINSFGFGGANAHVILEDAASFLSRHNLEGRHATVLHRDYPDSVHEVTRFSDSAGSSPSIPAFEPSSGKLSEAASDLSSEILSDWYPTPKLFVVSANDQEGVKRNFDRIQSYLALKTCAAPSFLSDLALTLDTKRTTLPWKSYVVATSLADLREQLPNFAPPVRSSSSAIPRVAFVFTGQGAQWHAMGKGLSIFTTFAKSLQRSETILKSLGCPWSLTEELSRTEAACNLRETDYSQPACTALQIALVNLLNDFGIHPLAVIGHSSGEIAAAYTAGFIDQEAAMKIAWLRGQVSKGVSTNGGMLAVSASADSIQHHLDSLKSGRAVVGCFNSYEACTSCRKS
jgi:acyl transferase domain-containing protein